MKAIILLLLAFSMCPTFGEQKMKKYTKPEKEKIKQKLNPIQYKVTQEEGTEAAFKNEYWDHKEAGIYVDVVTGEPLFSSLDKFDSGTGWPSFSKPIEKENITTKTDQKFSMQRTEVRSNSGDSHLGHVFNDGPTETGLRYCINSAALRFVPVEKMNEEGYGEYLYLFKSQVSSKKSEQNSIKIEKAIVAGGCFWGVEELFRKLPGVIETVVGYTGGNSKNPTYEDVKTGKTGHAEAIEISYNSLLISYAEILNYFFRLHDPTTLNRQQNDIGTQYRSSIFYVGEEQKKLAQKVKDEVNKSGKWKKPVVTEIVPFTAFYKAEDYHQDYLQKNPNGYTCHFLRD